MMIYYSKADLLRGIWKSSRDTRLVDRMIERWEILVKEGWYEYLGWKEEKVEVVKSCKNDNEEIKKWKESNEAYKEIIEIQKAQIEKLQAEVENSEASVNMEYYKKLYEDTERELNDIKFRKKWATWSWLRKKFRVGEEQYEAFSEEWDNI